MSVMTQPVGSVLGTNPISRTYLRSSPIVCAFDTLHFTAEIIVNRIVRIDHCDSFRDAITEALESRFKHVLDESEGHSTFQTQTVVRWVLFVLGTHGCILKLARATGKPWTKTWGFAYVLSFLVFEFAILLCRQQSPRLLNTTSSQHLPSAMVKAVVLAVFLNGMLLGFGLCGLLQAGLSQWLVDKESQPLANVANINVAIAAASFTIALTSLCWIMYLSYLKTMLCRIWVSRPDLGEQLLVLERSQAEEIRRNHFYYIDRIKVVECRPHGSEGDNMATISVPQ